MSKRIKYSNSKPLFNNTDIEYMKKACLLCDESNCKVRTAVICVKNGMVIQKAHNEIFSAEIRSKEKYPKGSWLCTPKQLCLPIAPEKVFRWKIQLYTLQGIPA